MTSAFRAGIRARLCPQRLALAGLLAVAFLLGSATGGHAHAALEESSPTAGEVVSGAPANVTITFTEPLEQTYSRMELYDSQGFKVENLELSFADDGYTMALALPGDLPNGTWSVLWRTLSTADGHTAQNYITFTIGSNADIAAVVIPGTGSDPDAAPQRAKTTSRWAALLGAALLIAAWPVWSTVFRPALDEARPHLCPILRRMQRYMMAAAILAIAGSVYALVVQAWTLPDGTLLDRVVNTLGQTRYGRLWLLRFGLLLCLSLVLPACGWWFWRRRQAEGIAAWGLSMGAVAPFSLIAHASAQPSGRTFAIVADAVHMFAAAVWFGSIALLVTVLLPGLRAAPGIVSGSVLRKLLPRFTIMALIAMATVGITGFYAGWLQVGNLAALTGTGYGRALIVKLAALLLVLGLAAINLFVIERQFERRDAGEAAQVWTSRLRWTVGGELALAIILLAAVGQMTSLQPARDVVVEESRQISVQFNQLEPSSTLLLWPGIAGVNHFRLEIGGPSLPPNTDVLLRLTMPDREDLGTREIQLSRVAGNAFEHHGSEIGIAGEWEITAIVREPGSAQLSQATLAPVGSTSPNVDVPGDPWRFKTLGGVTGLVLILAGVAGALVGWRSGPGTTRKESTGLGVAALLLGAILLFQARIDPVLANATSTNAITSGDISMIERGEEIYTQQCLSCHGPGLRGDGPASEGMVPPPADFSAPHTMVHDLEDLVYWIRNGKQGTAMPAFGGTLSDQDIRDVLSFIYDAQDGFRNETTALDPASCTVDPTTLADIEAMSGIVQVDAEPLPQTTDEIVDGATYDAIASTTDMLLACTNATDTMRRLSLFSDAYLASQFAAGVPESFVSSPETSAAPLPEESRLRLVEIRDVQHLADGRVVATVDVNDPTGQLNGANEGSSPVVAQLVFVQSGDEWLIDRMLVIA